MEFGVACPSPAQYAGETIDQLFVQRVMDLTDKSDPDVALAAADGITIHLANCDKDYGSSMIAMANGCPEPVPGQLPGKGNFVSGGDGNEYSYLAPFIQLAIMGMPCYASPDGPDPLRRPAGAVCSAIGVLLCRVFFLILDKGAQSRAVADESKNVVLGQTEEIFWRFFFVKERFLQKLGPHPSVEAICTDQGLHALQGEYPCAISSSLAPLNSCRLRSLISAALAQSGLWNFLELVFRT